MKCAIERQAAFYRGYAADDRDLAPLAILWAAVVASWLLVYAVGCLAPMSKPKPEIAAQGSSLAAARLAP